MNANVSNRLALFVASGLLVWAACDQGAPTSPPSGPDGLSGILALTILPGGTTPGTNDGNRTADDEEFELCKDGSDATFDYTIVEQPSGPTTIDQITLLDGECRILALFGAAGALVTVTEQDPVGFDLDNVVLTTRVGGVETVGSPSTNPTVGPVLISGSSPTLRGALAVYTNVAEPEGGEGCTPGFWKNWTGLKKQPNVWPGGTDPSTTLFSDIFEPAFGFPGMTLLAVLQQGGGGLKALGRHTAAAYLNALSGNVMYDLSPTAVVNMFNAVYPDGDYNGLKGTFEGFNQQETPGFCE